MGSSFSRRVEKAVKSALGKCSLQEWSNPDLYTDMESLRKALRAAGVESCNLIVGFDFTNSNQDSGKHSFHGLSLHALDSKYGKNPYEMALSIIGGALTPTFDEDGLIPAYVFGDISTKAETVRQIGGTAGCRGIEGADGLLTQYRKAVSSAFFSGPTSFAPLIDKAVQVVRSRNNSFHILLILADGQVTPGDCHDRTVEAIIRASAHPLSIIMVGLGDGPWDEMEKFDDDIQDSKFDNFQFVRFAEFQALLESARERERQVAEAAFAVCALQEVPAQHAAMSRLGLLGGGLPTSLSSETVALRDRSRSPRRLG